MTRLLDAWAVLAWMRGEGEATSQMRRLLLSARRGTLQFIMSVINLGEVYADAFAAVLAIERGARLVTGDPDFQPLEVAKLLKIQWLTRRHV